MNYLTIKKGIIFSSNILHICPRLFSEDLYNIPRSHYEVMLKKEMTKRKKKKCFMIFVAGLRKIITIAVNIITYGTHGT